MRKLQSPLFAAVVSAAVTALIVGGVSFAQTTAPTITACVHNESGNVRIVADSGGCMTNETATTWNQQGEKGDTGSAGPLGPAGLTGSTGPQGPAGIPCPQPGCISANDLPGQRSWSGEISGGVITGEKIAQHTITSQNLAPSLLVSERANMVTTSTSSPASVDAGGVATVVLNVGGIASNDLFTVTGPALPGLLVTSYDVQAPGTVIVRLYNVTANATTLTGNEAWTVRWLDVAP